MADPNVYCVLLARREDVSRDEFLRAWLGEHRKLIGELPGLADVQLLPVADPASGGPDGVGLLYFRSGAPACICGTPTPSQDQCQPTPKSKHLPPASRR